ncbi:flagellar hook-associated protein 2 [Tenuibacillus multivorans]|uniref:Flagellar hook-associated protein 2 n=1 Tax=Tenuibacillus multivorans TaxID=237069 RepID=A0A1H0G8J5_9BACI|nr:flagellar hook-associated protein 2 [Tenuibacillus multivorans]GEL78702.1 flagellar hook-associated protein 2 [Tenuibacillus multivorans]SDO03154.1 flagellar hook-associated protein 2 [Tenuibacillus multivorans]
MGMMSNNMRIGGLASGMDIDSLVNDLMKAERIPLDKMKQDQTWLTWQRDAYREINTKLSEFQNMFMDMKLSHAYQSKTTISSQEGAVTAIATNGAQEGTYSIEVTELASKAMNVSQQGISDGDTKIDPDAVLETQSFKNAPQSGTLEFSTFDENGNETVHSVNVDVTQDSLNDVLNRISENSDGEVRAFYDANSDKVFLERTKSGDFNTDESRYLGSEIGFDGQTNSSFLTDTLQIKNGTYNNQSGQWEPNEVGGTNAEFNYNGLQLESFTNEYTLNDVNFKLTNTTEGTAFIDVSNDKNATVDKITEFVDKYNEIIETITEKTSEERHRDYPPLTDAQKEEMTEREIELWEEKAVSGVLRNDNILQSGLSDMRSAWYETVDTGNEDYNRLADLGITTSSNYRDNGKLVFNEGKFREAIENNPDAVRNLLSNSSDGDDRGLINRVEDSLKNTMDFVSEKAGTELRTEQQYSMGRELISMEKQISEFERRLQQVESRYWDQFTQMEKAIQQMNQQSAYLMQQFGGGQ